MKLPLLTQVYPFSKALAELYQGWTEGIYFKRIFKSDTLEEQINQVNSFLKEQGFKKKLPYNAFESSNLYEEMPFSFYKNLLGYDQIVLVYEQPVMTNHMKEVIKFLDHFRNARDWKKFHTSKNLSMAIGSEAGEILDLFLWDRGDNVDHEKLEKELADILIYCMYLADNFKIDLLDAIVKKTVENDLKYPVDKAKGSDKKYDEL